MITTVDSLTVEYHISQLPQFGDCVA